MTKQHRNNETGTKYTILLYVYMLFAITSKVRKKAEEFQNKSVKRKISKKRQKTEDLPLYRKTWHVCNSSLFVLFSQAGLRDKQFVFAIRGNLGSPPPPWILARMPIVTLAHFNANAMQKVVANIWYIMLMIMRRKYRRKT